MERTEENWNAMQTIITAKEHLGTQLLLSLDTDSAQIKGSMSPNKEDESIQLKAELTPAAGSSEKQSLTLEGTISDKSANIKVFNASHKFLEELNCNETSCKRTGPSGEVISTRDMSTRDKERLSDKSLNTEIEFNDEMFFNGKIGKVLNKDNAEIGSASLKNRPDWVNLPALFAGRDRTFYQTGEYKNNESKENRSLDITYTHNSKDEVTFEGNFKRTSTTGG